MMEESGRSNLTWDQLANDATSGLQGQGSVVESTRRLILAYNNHSGVMNRLTGVIVFLSFVLMVLAAVQVAILIER